MAVLVESGRAARLSPNQCSAKLTIPSSSCPARLFENLGFVTPNEEDLLHLIPRRTAERTCGALIPRIELPRCHALLRVVCAPARSVSLAPMTVGSHNGSM